MNRRPDTVQPGRDALIGYSLAGEIVSWNPGATQLFGWTAQEAVGRDARLLVPDDQRLTEDELWRRVRCGEQWEAPAVQRLHKSGQIVDVSIWMSPVLDGSGTTIGVVSCSREVDPGADGVTFRRLFDALPDAVICFDTTGVITRVNARAGQLFGCLPEQLIDHTIEEFVSGVSGPGGVVGGALPAVDAARHGLGNGRQLYGHHLGGAAFPVEVSVASIDAADRPVTVVTVRDAVGQSERRLRRMAEVITIGLGLRQIDPPDYLYANPAFYQILGLDPASPRPGFDEVTSLIHPDDLPAAAAAAAARVKSGETVQQELRMTRLDGEPRWIRFTGSPVTDEHGAVIRVATTVEDITPAKNAEIALRESEERFRQMAGSLDVGFLVREIGERNFAYVSPAFLRTFGFDEARPTLGFDEVTSRIHPDDRPALAAAAARVDSGETVQEELRMTRLDGEPRWIRFTGSPVTDEHGTVIRVAATLEDVTAAKNAEIALRESEERFRQMVGSLEVGFVLRDIGDRNFAYTSPAFLRIFGFDEARPTLGFDEVTSLIHPDDLPAAAAATARLESGETMQHEIRITRLDGEPRWIRIAGSPVTDEHGTVIRVADTVEDVTPAKTAEIALRESEERFRRTAGALQVGISLRQLEPPKVLYVNDKYVQLMGVDPTLIKGAPVESAMQRVHPDDRDGVMADYWQRAATGQPAQAEMRIIQPSGEIRWLRFTTHPVQPEPGTPALAAGTVEDITVRKIAEAALQSARRDAELANRAKSEFLSRMSHELRTPLNAVLGFAQLLELESPSDSQLDAVRHILRGGRHLLEMINDLLDISRIETDQLDLSTEPVAVADVLIETIGLMRPAATLNRIEIRWDPAQPHADQYVLADRRRLRQVVLNLLSNAIKYNQHQGLVEVRCGRPDESHLTLAITDTGIGMRAEDLHRLFNPFDRLGQQSSEIEGTGIGLALSKRLVAIMGGRLEVESTPGRGSTFTVVMPLAPATTTSHEQDQAIDRDTAPATGPAATLLYIEDNRSNVELMTRILGRRPGWRLVHASDGRGGLQQAAIVHPALIFLDLHLPDLNGIDVLRALRADPDSANIPLVVVSADASPGQIALLRSAGAQHYLTKPFDVPEIFRLLDRYAHPGGADRSAR